MAESLKLAQMGLEIAREAGAEGVWIRVVQERQIETWVRDGRLEKWEQGRSRSMNLQLWDQHCYSSHQTTDFSPDALRRWVKDALTLTRALEPDPDRVMPEPPGAAGMELRTYDPAVDSLDSAKRLAICMTMDQEARKHERLRSAISRFRDQAGGGAAVSSNGFSGEWQGTVFLAACDVTVRDTQERHPEGASLVQARILQDLPAAAQLGADALDRALAQIGARPLPGGKQTLVVAAEAGERLIRALTTGTDGRTFQQGRSMWEGREKQKLFPNFLAVTDMPLLPGALGSRPFDDEGRAAQRLDLIREGALQNLYLDRYYGRKLGRAPTTGSPSNQIVAPGSRAPSELMGGTGLYITGGLGGNFDPTTGNFSFGLRGHHFENGRIGAPLAEMTVAGNLLELFGHLVEVGNDPWNYSWVRCPAMAFEGVDVSG